MNLNDQIQRDSFITCARAKLLTEPEPSRVLDHAVLGDYKIAGFNPDPARIRHAVGAAVLVPVVFRHGSGNIILTERSAALRKHSGQISFPGGRVDAGEAVCAAALREAEEEIGLRREFVMPLGFLPSYYTGTGYRITPLVGLVDSEARLTPNPDEVARIVEAPLSILSDMDRYRFESAVWEGRERRFYVIDYPDAYIWGATAALLRILFERLSSE